jgi:hypothetical protein
MVWQAIAYRTDRSDINFSNILLANFLKKYWIIEVLHNSESLFLVPEFQIITKFSV